MRKLLSVSCALLFLSGVAACGASSGDESATTTSADAPVTPTTSAPASSTTSDETTTDATASDDSTPGTDESTTTSSDGPPATGTAAEYRDSLVKGFSSGDPSSGELVIPEDAAKCVAPKWIDTIGVDTLRQKGTKPAELEENGYSFDELGLSTDQATTMVDAFASCDVDLYRLLIDSLANDLDDTQKSCLEKELTPAVAKDFLITSLTAAIPSEETQKKLTEMDQTCKLSDDSGSGSGG